MMQSILPYLSNMAEVVLWHWEYVFCLFVFFVMISLLTEEAKTTAVDHFNICVDFISELFY